MGQNKDKAITYGQITLCVLFVIVIVVGAIMDCGCVATKDFYSLKLYNNIFAKDVSSEEVIAFLEQDLTSEHEYIEYIHKDCLALPASVKANVKYVVIFDKSGTTLLCVETLHDYITSGYMCINFAVDLHNNAEKAGIRCAVVDDNNGHVFNAFYTTDKGLVYSDASVGSDAVWTIGIGDTSKYTIKW